MPGMATRTRSPHCANWPSFLALAADGILVWVEGESPDHHNFSHESLGRATERPLLVAGDRGPVVKHAIAAAAPKSTRWSMSMAGCAPGSPTPSVTRGDRQALRHEAGKE